MNNTYILANDLFDNLFGFSTSQILFLKPMKMSPHEFHIREEIKQNSGKNVNLNKILIIDEIEPYFLMNIGKILDKKENELRQYFSSKNMNHILRQDYIEYLGEYLSSQERFDRVIITNSRIEKEVREDLKNFKD